MGSTASELEQETAAAVSGLADAVARLSHLAARGGLQSLAEAALPQAVLELVRAADHLEGLAATGVARVHASGVLPVATTAWLQNEASLSKGAATSMLALACSLGSDYSSTGAAWSSGAISRAHAAVLTQSVDKVARGLAYDDQAAFRAQAEHALLDFALSGVTPGRLAKKAARVRSWVDEWGMRRDADEAERAQFLRFTDHGDGVKVEGFLSHETHAVIATALEQAVELRHRDGTLPAEDRVEGDDVVSRRLRRRRQPYLNVIALADVCGALLERGDLGSKHGVIPRVTLDVDIHDLVKASTLFGSLRKPADADGAPFDRSGILRFLCDAEVVAAVVTGARPRCTCGCPTCGCDDSGPTLDDLLHDASREILYLGRSERVVSPRLRRALEVREQGRCSRPGCGAPAGRCRAHHVEHWADGGLTDIDNCVLVCERHHRDLHSEGGWRLERDPAKRPTEHGYFVWIPPSSQRRP